MPLPASTAGGRYAVNVGSFSNLANARALADKVITATGLDQRWPEIFEVRASCADAAVDLAGVPFEFWSLALFALSGIVLASICMTPSRRA